MIFLRYERHFYFTDREYSCVVWMLKFVFEFTICRTRSSRTLGLLGIPFLRRLLLRMRQAWVLVFEEITRALFATDSKRDTSI